MSIEPNANPTGSIYPAASIRADGRLDGLERRGAPWGDYPIDDILIRSENRTVYEIIRRINQGGYVMDPDFQRDFVWSEKKQSRLIESVVMRIPLPVFYVAEDEQGRMVVVDGRQRLSTFRRLFADELRLKLPDRKDLNGRRFSELTPKLQNRIEDCNLTLYVIDAKVPERARLDIFERVNAGEPLTRQQMRNSLYMGPGTYFLREQAHSDLFVKATGDSLSPETMRDREFVNRFCAFRLLSMIDYRGDMDQFLADCLRRMNQMNETAFVEISKDLRRGLVNNLTLFGKFAFRKHRPGQEKRSVLNASLWDVMSTGLSRYDEESVSASAGPLREAFYNLLDDEDFNAAITYGTNDVRRVKVRFAMARESIRQVLG